MDEKMETIRKNTNEKRPVTIERVDKVSDKFCK